MTSPRDFLLRVLPWPTDDTPGFINVHAQMKIDGKTPWTGWPTRDIDAFLQKVYWALSWPTPPDLYMCMSRQARTRPDAKGNERAAKSNEFAQALKSIFLDIDVKDPPKGYASLGEAVAALTAFCTSCHLPSPTALVASGGGLHAHWISDRPLTAAEWQPYAEGLKAVAITHGLRCDAGVTADSARVLRIPGTFNYKIPGHPRPVRILHMKATDYDFATALANLPPLAGLHSIPKPTVAAIPGRPSAAFASVPVESLGEGISREPLPPLDWTPIGKECGWFREALSTGGRDFSQGLWNLTTLAATFLDDGHVLAHRMARGHPGYTREETDLLWERKQAERASSGLGWPSCKAIHAEGSTACAICPLLAGGKSPINLGRVPQLVRPAGPPAAFVGVAPTTPHSLSGHVATSPSGSGYIGPTTIAGSGAGLVNLVPLTNADMPDRFEIVNGLVHRVVHTKVPGGAPNTDYLQVFYSEFFHPWAQSNPDALHFITSVDKGSYRDVTVLRKHLNGFDLEKVLLDQGVSIFTPNQTHMKDFIVSWLAKLNKAAASHMSAPFGWVMNGTACEGFSYGSVLYRHDGTLAPAGILEQKLQDMYGPQGDEQPWLAAFQTIVDQKRLGLEVMVGASFGSPLMTFASEYVAMYSVWGETGGFKSTAMRIATAVWGNPKLAKENETATENSVIHRLGRIRNLPYLWDEIKDEKAQASAFTVLFNSMGKEKSRMTSEITMRETGIWSNIIGIAANRSFSGYIITQNPDTEAGLVRLFEWKENPPLKGAAGLNNSSQDVGVLLKSLDSNYGQLGKRWAAFLGANYDLCKQRVEANGHWFEQASADPTKSTNAERFWVSFCAAVLSGAELANEHLGLNFHVAEMRSFLLEKLLEQRTSKGQDMVQGGSPQWTEDRLGWFINAHIRNTLRTNTAPAQKAGMPAPVDIITCPDKGHDIYVQWVMQANELRISVRALNDWLKSHTMKSDTRVMKQSLEQHYGARTVRLRLGAGCPGLRQEQTPVYIIPVLPGTPLWTSMHQTGETDGQVSGSQMGSPVEEFQRAGREDGAPHIGGLPTEVVPDPLGLRPVDQGRVWVPPGATGPSV